MFSKLQKRWGLTSGWQVVAILLVFSLAGISILPVRRWFFHLMGVTVETPSLLRFILWLLIVFPAYQVFLLIYGAIFGQFAFFWEKEKRMFRWIARRLGLVRSV